MQQYCVVCGKPLREGERVGPFCIDCFVKSFKLLCVPEKVVFDYCKYCGAYRVGHRWVEGGELGQVIEDYLRTILSNIKPCRSEVEGFKLNSLKYLTIPSWRTMVLASFSISIKGVDKVVEQEYTIEVRANPTICPSCKNARGGDYEVLVQIRGATPAEVASALEKLLEADSRVRNSIIDIVEYKNGVDMLVLDIGVARRLAKELKKKYIATTKVTGEDVGVTSRGKLRRRTVISVRIRGVKS